MTPFFSVLPIHSCRHKGRFQVSPFFHKLISIIKSFDSATSSGPAGLPRAVRPYDAGSPAEYPAGRLGHDACTLELERTPQIAC